MTDVYELRRIFRETYGGEPRFFRAPGRVNLIGEHTDYNDGFVLPIALQLSTFVAGAARRDRIVRVRSLDVNEQFEFDLDHTATGRPGDWSNYIEGVARSLEGHSEAQGVSLSGADLLIKSDVPIGGGLSSSAALEISTGFALLSLSGLSVDRITLAKAGQKAEHDYVGAKVGIMDQLASTFGRAQSAMLIDCRSLAIQHIVMEIAGVAIVVCDTGVKHNLAASEYNARRAECEQAVALLNRHIPNIRALRDVGVEDFERLKDHLPEPIRKRCRHVVTENARTLAAAHALSKGDVAVMGQLMYESHKSLRDDYEVSSPELDKLVETAARITGVIGARMTGGGFGGCTVNLVRNAMVEEFRENIVREYKAAFQDTPTLHTVTASNGAEEIHL